MTIISPFVSSARLDKKITSFIILILAVSMTIFSFIVFDFLKRDLERDKIKDVKISMASDLNTIQKNVEMCNMSTQVFFNANRLMDFIADQVDKKEMTTEEIISFYKSEIGNLEKISNSNPYLYNIRIYVNSEDSIEMMPILYNYSRLKKLEWAKDKNIETGTWKFDYQDTIFSGLGSIPAEHVVSLVSKISDYEHRELGVIEVATTMELLFPSIYSSTSDEWSCFIDQDEKCYYDSEISSKWIEDVKPLLETIKEKKLGSYYETIRLGNEEVIVACEYVKTLNGYLMKIISLEKDNKSIAKIRNSVIGFLIIGTVLATILIGQSIRSLLKRLYEIIKDVNLIGKGNLDIRVPATGNDEVGDLGRQINLMLEHMTKLMEQGIQKERLIKDTEIKALQNQINAHFIYNVLESIKMMAEIKEQYDISDALTSLGKLLRYTMRWGEQSVTVEEEIEYIRNYLALINLRFDYRIILSINMTEELLKQRVPKMSLQPIVENAIYHGIEELAEDTTIYIKGLIQKDSCCIEIMDSGIGMTEAQVEKLRQKIAGDIVEDSNKSGKSKGNGLGLKNVQDRIVMCFGKQYGISIVSREHCYTKVIVRIPYVASEGGNV